MSEQFTLPARDEIVERLSGVYLDHFTEGQVYPAFARSADLQMTKEEIEVLLRKCLQAFFNKEKLNDQKGVYPQVRQFYLGLIPAWTQALLGR